MTDANFAWDYSQTILLTIKLARGLVEISTYEKLSGVPTQTKCYDLPSVARAAFSRVTTAHPADPENPDINSLRASHAAIYSEL